VGVVARELQVTMPSMGSTIEIPPGEAHLSVNTSEMAYMLINAVKELAEENKKQDLLIKSSLKKTEH
jgi:quercetin dioxygenase-like cupin family protein